MKISDIRIRLVAKDETKLRAVASLTIEDSMVIHDIKVIEGKDGLFISMPRRKTPDGEYKDIVHPNKNEIREQLKEEILKAYDETVKAEQ